MASPDFSTMRDSEVLKAVQPGFTSDVDKYYIELAHSIVDSDWLSLGESATPGIEDLETEYEHAKADYEAEQTVVNELAMLKAQIKLRNAQIELMKERHAKMEPQKPLGKSSFIKGDVVGGLKTRSHKRRNGSSTIRRHRSRRVPSRKIKTRNA